MMLFEGRLRPGHCSSSHRTSASFPSRMDHSEPWSHVRRRFPATFECQFPNNAAALQCQKGNEGEEGNQVEMEVHFA